MFVLLRAPQKVVHVRFRRVDYISDCISVIKKCFTCLMDFEQRPPDIFILAKQIGAGAWFL